MELYQYLFAFIGADALVMVIIMAPTARKLWRAVR